MPVKMRWSKEARLKDVGFDEEFTTHRSKFYAIEDHSRFRRVYNVKRVALSYNKRGLAVEGARVPVVSQDGRVCVLDEGTTVHLIQFYEEPIVQTITVEKGTYGPSKPKKKRK